MTDAPWHLPRRAFLRMAPALGAAALQGLTHGRAGGAHHAPRARSVIWLGMVGAPSQVDLFAHKPELDAMDDQFVPPSLLRQDRFAFLGDGKARLLASPWRKTQHGASGAWLSELLPYHRTIVDRVAFVHSMQSDEFNHVPAQLLQHTGAPRLGRPTMGAWLSYGLGSANEDLPAYVVLASGKAGRCGASCWGSGFLPSRHQGVQLRGDGDPVLFLGDPPGFDAALRQARLDAIVALDAEHSKAHGDPEIATRLAAYELAARMQAAMPGVVDLRSESKATLGQYGVDPAQASFARNCLLARRLVERGVRFVHLVHGGWDHHGGTGDQNLLTNLPQRCREVDQASAALVLDLQARGLLDDTLVVFAGEFGRTPMLQGERRKDQLGRDHLRTAFTVWLAGGGVRAGLQFGVTDELGLNVVRDPVHVHDLQATILHLLGIDHERLTFRHLGRDFRLTDVSGRVVSGLLA